MLYSHHRKINQLNGENIMKVRVYDFEDEIVIFDGKIDQSKDVDNLDLTNRDDFEDLSYTEYDLVQEPLHIRSGGFRVNFYGNDVEEF